MNLIGDEMGCLEQVFSVSALLTPGADPFLLWDPDRQRRLVGYSLWSRKELDMTE